MKILIFIVGMICGALFFYLLSFYGACEYQVPDKVLQGVPVVLGNLDASSDWLQETTVILYPLEHTNNPRMSCLLVIRIPEQLKEKGVPSSRLDLQGFNAGGSIKPVFLPELSPQQTKDEEYVSILLDFGCPLQTQSFSKDSKLLISAHKRVKE